MKHAFIKALLIKEYDWFVGIYTIFYLVIRLRNQLMNWLGWKL
jgi:hypothetical protein